MKQSTEQPAVVHWHPWQRRAFADRSSRIAADIWHRQAGKDFCTAGLAVDDAAETGSSWYIVSVTQRQADQTFAKCRRFTEAMRRAAGQRAAVEDEHESLQYDRWLKQQFRFRSRELTLPGGGRVISLPGRDPDALAGLTGNLILTEFALFPGGGYDHWRVLFPLITRGYRIRILTTPRGKNTKAYEIAADTGNYTVRTQTIHDSIREGFVLRGTDGEPVSVEQFRRHYGDEAGWRREYECEWTGDLDALVRWHQLESAGRDYPFELVEITGDSAAGRKPFDASVFGQDQKVRRIEIGWDVARSGHLSVIWANGDLGGRRRLLRLTLMRNVPFAAQRSIVREMMDADGRTVGVGDATGIGADSNETLAAEYGDRWKPLVFTAATKSDLASRLITAYGDGEQEIPPTRRCKLIAADIHALQREPEVSDARRIRVVEGVNPLCEDSHNDIAWADALALTASGLDSGPPPDLWTT